MLTALPPRSLQIVEGPIPGVCAHDLGFNPFPLILKRPPPSPNIKIGFRRFHFNIKGVSGACGHDWPLSLKSLNYSREP